jgi:hypothetical protein
MDGICRVHGGAGEINTDCLGNLGTDGKIILK